MKIPAGGTRAGVVQLLRTGSPALLKLLGCSLHNFDTTSSGSLHHTQVLQHALI